MAVLAELVVDFGTGLFRQIAELADMQLPPQHTH
jgi:hypothetical protein